MHPRWFTRLVLLVVAATVLWSLQIPGGNGRATAVASALSPAREDSLRLGPVDNLLAQIPSGVLNFVTRIVMPNWTSGGPPTTIASFDILSFDPVRRYMYVSDKPNNAVTVINTTNDQIVGMVQLPADCAQIFTTRGRACPSGVQVIPDLHRLVVTDRGIPGGTNFGFPGAPPTQPTDAGRIMVFDITSPTPPWPSLGTIQLGPLNTNTFQPDELDYDPITHRVYVGNTAGAPFLTVVDVLSSPPVLVGQIPLPTDCGVASPTPANPGDCGVEQPRFNPVDTMIYQNLSADSKVLRIDPNVPGPGSIVRTFPSVAPCTPNGIDIDPLTDTALLGCSNAAVPAGLQVLLDLSSGNLRPVNGANVSGTDGLYFSNNLRRWYTASQNNENASTPACPAMPGTPPRFPVVGVFTAGAAGAASPATGVGVACSGRGSHTLGVDPIGNKVYVPTNEFPPTTGPAPTTCNGCGVLVFRDSAPPAQPPVRKALAILAPLGTNQTHGQVKFERQGSVMQVEANLHSLPSGTPVSLVITTTVGNEVVPCAGENCTGTLIGDPLIDGVVTLSVGRLPVAQGRIKGGVAHGPGDFDGDSFVDIRDYGIWRQNFGASNCDLAADAASNCLVDISAYGIWRQNFGQGGAPAGGSSRGTQGAPTSTTPGAPAGR